MLLINIKDIKNYTTRLFVEDVYDDYLFVEGTVTTFSTFSISGRTNMDYYSEDEKKNVEKYARWGQLRPIFFDIIKGKKLPLDFKLVFMAAPSLTSDIGADPLCDSFFANIKYNGSTISITTGTSSNVFSLDKTSQNLWDKYVCNFLTKSSIDYEII